MHNIPHTTESKQKISMAKKGKSIKKHSPDLETRKKISQTLRKGKYITCIICGKKRFVSPAEFERGNPRFCSHECQGKYYSGKRHKWWNNGHTKIGANNPIWKGGISKLYPYKHLKNKKYRNWRKSVFERDNWTCQKCGVRSGNGKSVFLHSHHIKSYTHYKDLRYDSDNGITLCISCHKEVHSKNGGVSFQPQSLKDKHSLPQSRLQIPNFITLLTMPLFQG